MYEQIFVLQKPSYINKGNKNLPSLIRLYIKSRVCLRMCMCVHTHPYASVCMIFPLTLGK